MRLTIISGVVLVCCVAVTPCFSQEGGDSTLRERLRKSLLEKTQTNDNGKSLLGGDNKSLSDPYKPGSRAFDLLNGKSSNLDASSLSETLRRMRESDERMKRLTMNPNLLPPPQPWWMTLRNKAISLVKSLLSLAGLLIMGFIGLVALFWIGYSGWSLKRSVDVRGGVKRNPQFPSEEKNSPK